jgi:5,10-methylenetetrahydrofolate reductase
LRIIKNNRTDRFGVPVQYGVVVVKSAKMARFMNKNVSGITVPDWIIDEMDKVSRLEDRKKTATEITIRLVKEIAPMARGIHFMPLGWSDIVPEVIQAL